MNLHKKNNGWIIVEIIAALSVLAVIMVCLSLSARTFGRLNSVQLQRQQCLSAAQAQLDSIAITGERIGKDDLDRLWDGVEISVDEEEGKNEWEGLKLVKVTVVGMAREREVKVELSRYIASEGEAR